MGRATTTGGAVALAAAFTALSVAAPRAADDAAGQERAAAAAVEPSPWLFGDWAGARTRLRERGIDFQFGYVSEIAANPTGGFRNTATYTDQYTAGATLDLEKLIGLPAARFQVTFTERTGRNLSSDARLGTLQQVQEVFGRGQTARLTDFWFEQSYAGGLIDWKVGRMPFGEDFASFSCDFQNLTFCGADPGNLVGNYIYNWPISQWATRVKVNLPDFGYVQVGAYDMNPQYLGTRDALVPAFFPDSTGVMVPVEVGWLPSFGGGTLPGSYKVGAWYDTSSADSVVYDRNGRYFAVTGRRPARVQGRYGAYLNVQQQVSERLGVFLNVVVADNRTAVTDGQIAVGMVYTGPFAARPEDDIGVAVGATHVNDRVAKSERAQNRAGLGPVAVQDTEYAFELYYTLRPRPGILFRPNLQYVHRPGGTSRNPDAVVFGLKTVANF